MDRVGLPAWSKVLTTDRGKLVVKGIKGKKNQVQWIRWESVERKNLTCREL